MTAPDWRQNGYGIMGEFRRDPVCGMPVDAATARVTDPESGEVFCSEYCRETFLWRQASAPPWTKEMSEASRRIAYFSMEMALDERLPTYSGGLGILAGDMLRSCADLGVPIVGVTLVHRCGYFCQVLSGSGEQQEMPEEWSPKARLVEMPRRVQVRLDGVPVSIRAWRLDVRGTTGKVVPVLMLDTDLQENAPEHRHLTDSLYGGDERYRLSQEAVLGIGGIRMLEALGYSGIERVHLNEGHAALAALELLRRRPGRVPGPDFEGIRRMCVFTTHTPVPAGHDSFDLPQVAKVISEPIVDNALYMLTGRERLNLTQLALNLSHYVNGVARSHEQVAQQMFPGHDVHAITNGVHSGTWTSPSFAVLFDRQLPGWREDPAMLRRAFGLGDEDLLAAHRAAKLSLLQEVEQRTRLRLDASRLTLGFARRATAYKRTDLLFRDLERLRKIGRGRLQLIFAGKAHPRDEAGKELIRHVVDASRRLGNDVPLVYLANYDLRLAKKLISGVDVWLNTPARPLEASGTSGMKAAHNGVPSLSILDGWWLEGWVEGVTGWAIGGPDPASDDQDAAALYESLERRVLPAYEAGSHAWAQLMRQTIALNASFFNTHRVVQQYVTNSYLD